MKTRFLLSFFLLASALVFTAGCSTPDSRIKAQPELFASLAPTDQELIKAGKVGVGFSPEMVKLALGDPDRIWMRTDASGTDEVWSYTMYESEGGVYLYRGYYHRSFYTYNSLYPYYLGFSDRRETEKVKIQFRGGRVASIEQRRDP